MGLKIKAQDGEPQRLPALDAANFFLADVQTGLGPFLAAYLASSGWNPGQIGLALTWGGIVTIALQTPAGALVDRLRAKRSILVIGTLALGAGALLLAASANRWPVYLAQTIIGGAAPFLAPTLAAITLGLVGPKLFDRRFGRNQAFNAAGNVACALAIIAISRWMGNQAIFLFTAVLSIPTIVSVLAIRGDAIDHNAASGGTQKPDGDGRESLRFLMRDHALLFFLISVFLFHFSNAAMLPQLGEMLAKGAPQVAAQFMSACVIVTQLVISCTAGWIGRFANRHGRRGLLLAGFGVLPLRAVLYTLTAQPAALISIQILDGVANAIFTVVAVLVVADRTKGTGRFNLVQGALATSAGLGAALSNTFGGKIAEHYGFNDAFLALGAVAVMAVVLLWAAVPETLRTQDLKVA